MQVQVYKINQKRVEGGGMPSFNELNDGSQKLKPSKFTKIRNVQNYPYQLLEDSQGNVYLINDDEARLFKFDERNLELAETPYLMDIATKKLLAERNKEPVSEVVEEVDNNINVSEETGEENE